MYYRIPALELSLSVPLVLLLQAVFRRAGARVWFMTSCCCLAEFGSSCFNHASIESWFVWLGPWYSTPRTAAGLHKPRPAAGMGELCTAAGLRGPRAEASMGESRTAVGLCGLVWAANGGGWGRATDCGGWRRAENGGTHGKAADGSVNFPVDGGLGRATDYGWLVLAWGRTLSRHRRIPSLHLSPVVSGRSTGWWELAPCQNSERRVASSSAVAMVSLQNSQEYSTNKEILAGKGDEASGDFHCCREKNRNKKKTF